MVFSLARPPVHWKYSFVALLASFAELASCSSSSVWICCTYYVSCCLSVFSAVSGVPNRILAASVWSCSCWITFLLFSLIRCTYWSRAFLMATSGILRWRYRSKELHSSTRLIIRCLSSCMCSCVLLYATPVARMDFSNYYVYVCCCCKSVCTFSSSYLICCSKSRTSLWSSTTTSCENGWLSCPVSSTS